MPNFKQLNQSNVIAFKLRTQPPPPQPNEQKRLQQHTPKPKASSEANEAFVRTSSQRAEPTRELVYEQAPWLVRRIIRWNRSKYTRNMRLPELLSRKLQRLCDHKHPAGQVLKDWLDDNQRILPDDFEETYERPSCAEESKQ